MPGKKILIIEDEVIIARGIKVMLEDRGYEIIGMLRTGEDAVEFMKSNDPDIILMDKVLAGQIDGITAYNEIKNFKDTPAIFITAHSDRDTLDKAKFAAPAGFILKPIKKEELFTAIEIALYRFESQKKIRESEEHFRSTFEQAAVGMAHASLDGDFLRVNSKLCDIIGYSEDEIIGKNFRDIIEPDEIDKHIEITQELLSGKIKFYSIEILFATKSGGNVWVNLTVSISHGSSDYLIGVIEDITGRKEMENTLRDSEEKFRAISSSAKEGIVIVNSMGIIIYCNHAICELLGYKKKEFLYKEISMLLDKDSGSKYERKGISWYLRTGAESIFHLPVEVTIKKKDGREILVEVSISTIKHQGEWHSVGMIRDISERLEMEKKIAEIEEHEREKLAHDMHDGLGQQLTGIRYLMGHLILKMEKNAFADIGTAHEVMKLIDEAKDLTRDLSRGFSAIALEKEGFIKAVNNMLENIKKMFDVDYCFNYNRSISDRTVSSHMYFIIKEIITNSIKHSRARNLDIDFNINKKSIVLTIKNDGIGFKNPDPDAEGKGLKIIRYRLMKVKGSMEITSDASGVTFKIFAEDV